jgi:hypothetical protein
LESTVDVIPLSVVATPLSALGDIPSFDRAYWDYGTSDGDGNESSCVSEGDGGVAVPTQISSLPPIHFASYAGVCFHG